MRDAVRNFLAADAPLTASLPGGIYAGGEIGRQSTPTAFDANGELRPCALVALETETPVGPYPNSGRQFFTVNFYAFSGYAAIDAALARTFALLNRSQVGGPGVWEIQHVEDSGDLEDPGLLCSLRYSRWAAYRRHP
jgi:hypothetical protein